MKGRAAVLLVAILATSVWAQTDATQRPLLSAPNNENTSPHPEPSTRPTPPPPPPPPGPPNNSSTPPPSPTPARPPKDGSTPEPPPPQPQSPHSGEPAPKIVALEDAKVAEKWPSDKPASPPWHMNALLSPQDILLQEIRSLDEESTNEKVQQGVFEALDAIETKFQKSNGTSDGKSAASPALKFASNSANENSELRDLMEQAGLTYDEIDDDIDDDLDDPEWDDDDDIDDDIDDQEEVLFEQDCPVGCRCSGEFIAAKMARCTKIVSEQNFGPDIAHLKIEDAPAMKLKAHALREMGLQQLESIAFVNTVISEMDRSAFDGVRDMFSVNLTGNGLTGIHPDTFQNNTQLSLLTLSGNSFQNTQSKTGPYAEYFLDAPSVAEFDLSNNNLPRLLPTAFKRMPRLLYLNLRGNKLRAIERAVFHPLEELEEVDLSNNQLNGLPSDLFDDNEYFEILHVSGNNLTTLATIKATRLVTLEAANNKIKIIAKDDLVGLPELEKLDLKSNGLKRIHQHAFANLDDLTYLDISDNKLTTLTEHHLRTNSRLEILIINDNPGLETLPVFKTEDGTFSIYRMECADCGLSYLEEGTFDAMPALTRLNLARNHLSRFPKGLLSSLTSLRELDLSDNLFSNLEADMFRGVKTLNKLNLASNLLVNMPAAPFLMTPSLARLDISRNQLKNIWTDSAVPIQNLRFLNIRGNQLEGINVEDLKVTPKLTGLDISHNPLRCDQEFNEVVQWLTEHGVNPTETIRFLDTYVGDDDYSESEGLRQWTDLAGIICDIADGPPPRGIPLRPEIHAKFNPGNEIDDLEPLDEERGFDEHEAEEAWANEEQEYEDLGLSRSRYGPWYHGTFWPVVVVVLVTLAIVLLVANVAVCLAKRKGRGPVIRAPMILRPGLIDNKNCGLVYKPLQEEIPTPQMAKRGSFYSSSTFHYDKIVPESV